MEKSELFVVIGQILSVVSINIDPLEIYKYVTSSREKEPKLIEAKLIAALQEYGIGKEEASRIVNLVPRRQTSQSFHRIATEENSVVHMVGEMERKTVYTSYKQGKGSSTTLVGKATITQRDSLKWD